MQLIGGGTSLNKRLSKLVKKHENFALAVAWAGAGTEAFSAISQHKARLVKAVIGTHFYQTHPDVIDEFVGNQRCHFVFQPQGVFHPKVYLFWSDSGWDLLIGSANLTKGALTLNTELMIHVSSQDATEEIRKQAKSEIGKFWSQGEVATAASAKSYRALWRSQQRGLKRLSGNYGGAGKSKAPVHTEIMTMSWSKFLKGVKADPQHGFKERCELLALVRQAFEDHNSFAGMDLGPRKTIAGLPNEWNSNWGWFGSMSGAGYYHQAVNNNNPHLSDALDFIPLSGEVTRDNYNSYIEEFLLTFPNGRDGVGIASRLLALKRPDYFVCLDSKNKTQLCKDFGIKQSGMDYIRYWDDVVCRVMDSNWWNSPKPSNTRAAQVWSGRAAMLDALFYQP